ncbi:hypothetical protein Bca52824_089012 [Brassica carinata]|uniref:RRM domain-containing protein n=1 Tax=Brassica carinata TaxID=52824 RepID=A0A8X7PGW9_BRACI|nr:hypothetical protein Bca52824_089012 [Brassica carinata]
MSDEEEDDFGDENHFGEELEEIEEEEDTKVQSGNDLKSLNVKRLQSVPERILEHWRIRDGRGESLYPRSSFAIKLAGDVFAKETLFCLHKILWGEELSLARLLKKATVLLNTNTLSLLKSFGARGCRNCLRCTLLLVKGRNLYGLLTLRQRWANEEDRVKILSEKHCLVRVRLLLNARGKHVGYGFVEFASSNQAKMALERKNRQSLHCSKIILDEAPDFVEEAAVPIKTLFIASFPRYSTEISDIIDFFKDVGQVVRVRLEINDRGRFVGCGFVDFASANQANKALQNKNGEYLHDRKIFLADGSGATFIPPKFCIDHKVWYEEEDYLQEESLRLDSIQDVAAMEEGPDETPHSANNEVLLIANLSPQTTKTEQIIRFFKVVGSVVSVRLIVDHECKHVGYGFVEFDSSYEAEKALKELNGEYLHDHKILLMRGLDDETPHSVEEAATVRNKTLFVSGLSRQTKISEIVNFFKDVGEVVHVRLIVDRWGNLQGKGFVEFASANEAMKALEKKNGEYLNGSDVFLAVFETPPYHRRPKYKLADLAEKLWYEDSLCEKPFGQKPKPILRNCKKKTVFVDGLSYNTRISDIINFFKDVGEEIIRVRLIVDRWGNLQGKGFVEFASANEAMKALEKKNGEYLNGSDVFLAVFETPPYHRRPK